MGKYLYKKFSLIASMGHTIGGWGSVYLTGCFLNGPNDDWSATDLGCNTMFHVSLKQFGGTCPFFYHEILYVFFKYSRDNS